MTEEVTLAPCPKCGCDKADTEIHRKYWFVECMRCEYFSDANYTEAEAIAAWNARANQPPAQDGLVEALRFYANHLSFPLNAWVQPTKIDYSMGGDGHWPDGPPIPSSKLLADQGNIARAALASLGEQHD